MTIANHLVLIIVFWLNYRLGEWKHLRLLETIPCEVGEHP
jgi:uncharacterized protein (DUF2062 family)